MTENKKVIGATECEEDGIKFKSKWECKVYKMLKERFNREYQVKFVEIRCRSCKI